MQKLLVMFPCVIICTTDPSSLTSGALFDDKITPGCPIPVNLKRCTQIPGNLIPSTSSRGCFEKCFT